ncbi:MAG: hypothetical protein RR817_11190 [Niameybacter sp.]
MESWTIDFNLNDKKGVINVEYSPNKDVTESGFDMLQHLGFDVNTCIGYPTLHAYITDFEATGYRRYCGWIQILKCEYFESEKDTSPIDTKFFIDGASEYNSPFFAYGYPAELYDAPCNNLGSYYKLVWTAYTYLVEMPTHITQNTVSFIAGFEWGYTEWDELNQRKVMNRPMQQLFYADWVSNLQLLKVEFPSFSYK